MNAQDEKAEAAQRRFTVTIHALPKPKKSPVAYRNIGTTGDVMDLTDDATEFDSYVELLSNLPASFTGIPEGRARTLARKLTTYGAEFELTPEDGAESRTSWSRVAS